MPHITECSVCPNGKYRIAAATCSDHEPAVSCYECPKTANCLTEGGSRVLSLAGYWCGQLADAQSRLECTACPDGYCSSDEARPWNESCLSSRRGTLCGECAADHSEAVGTEECVPDAECNAARWLEPAVFAIGLVYVVLVVWLPINHHPLWKSITYFMQTVPLVSSPENDLLRATTVVFALDPSILGIHGVPLGGTFRRGKDDHRLRAPRRTPHRTSGAAGGSPLGPLASRAARGVIGQTLR